MSIPAASRRAHATKLSVRSASVLIALVCTVLGCGNGDSNSSIQADVSDVLTKQWSSYASTRPDWKGGVAVYVVTPRGAYFASADLGGDVTDDIHFRGASTTKLFTAAAIMLLHQQGKLDIDDVVTASIPGASEPYLPDTADYAIPYKEQITIRALLGHRAGVFDVANDPVPATAPFPYAGEKYPLWVKDRDDAHTFTIDELVGVVAVNQLSSFTPGTSYHYSDTGYSLLGKIVERVSGRRYDQFVQESLLAPVGLSDTTFPHLGADRALPPPSAAAYSYFRGVSYDVTDDQSLNNMSSLIANGNILTTPFDLATWLRALFAGEVGLSAATLEMMTDVMPTGRGGEYGLGMIHTPGLGFGHDGGRDGYASFVSHDPERDVTIALSARIQNADDLPGYYEFLFDTCRALVSAALR
jgi:D-alanyl-D-alanine carboxypeptidase